MSQTVLYHANCCDGFCAAWVLHKWRWPDAEYIHINYSDPVPWEKIDGNDVIVADFSFKRPVMLEVAERARSIVVLDHHMSAQKELDGLPFCTFDMSKSGGRLAWEYLFQERSPRFDIKSPPLLVKYTEDRDLWRWRLDASKEINMAIRSYPMDFETWDHLEKIFPTLRTEGEAILRFQNQHIEAAKGYCRRVNLRDPATDPLFADVPFINATFSISELLNAILDAEGEDGAKIACAWFQRSDGLYQYSLRSVGSIDVSEFASSRGGGGHKNAAGFEAKEFLW
jgi:uncharacterized protein